MRIHRSSRSSLLASLFAALAVVSLVVPAQAAPPVARSRAPYKHYQTHGNAKWGKKTLSVGKAREAIANAVARKLSVHANGLIVNPSEINVTVKLAADGKTAYWSAEPHVRADSRLKALFKEGASRLDVSMRGSIDVSLREVSEAQIAKRISEIKGRSNGASAQTDWRQAEKELGKYGNQPRSETIKRRAYQIWETRSGKADWQQAERELSKDGNKPGHAAIKKRAFAIYQGRIRNQAINELTLDLDGARVNFLNPKAYSVKTKQLMPKKAE
jgi:hypothetical protein